MSTIPRPQRLALPVKGDERGSLVALEALTPLIPFPIARVYYIFGTQVGVSRGFHAHKALQQVLIAVRGHVTLKLDDGKGHGESFVLSSPTEGLLITPGYWREMHDFSANCVLLVLASLPYDEADYIRDYATFVAQAQAKP